MNGVKKDSFRKKEDKLFPKWQSADMMIKAIVLLAKQDSKGITGTIATDREICTWHGLID